MTTRIISYRKGSRDGEQVEMDFAVFRGETGKGQPTQRLAGSVGQDPTQANPEEVNKVSNKYALSQ